MSSTDIVQNFSSVLDDIKKNKKDKIAVMRKNKLEAIIISVEEYERINEALELFEHIQIHLILKQREDTPLEEYVHLAKVSGYSKLKILF